MSKKKELIKNTFIIFFGKTLTQVVTFLMLPLYTAYLTTEEFGAFDLIYTYVLLFLPIISMQLDMAAFRFLVESRDNKKRSASIISNVLYCSIIMCSLFALIFIILNIFIPIKYFIYILLITIGCIFSSFFLQVARGFGKTIDYSIACIVSGVSIVVFNVLFVAILKMKIDGMFLSLALANYLTALYLFFKLKISNYIKFKSFNKKIMKEMLYYAFPLVPNALSWWVITVSNRTIISIFLDLAANGIYAVSNKFSTVLMGLSGVFNLSWTESVSLHLDTENGGKFVSETMDTIVKLFCCVCIGIVACMPFVFPILVNSSYNSAYLYIPILILAALFSIMINLISAIYIAKKETKKVAISSVLAAGITIVLNLSLINVIGLYAAPISTAIANFIVMVYRGYDIGQYVKLDFKKKTLSIIAITYIITSILYYINNLWLNIINVIFVVVTSIILNKVILKSSLATVKKFLKIK